MPGVGTGLASKWFSSLLLSLMFLPALVYAAEDGALIAASDISANEQLRQQARERAQLEQNTPHADIRLERPDAVLPDYPPNEKPCFVIDTIALQGEALQQFQWALKSVADARGRCLGGQGIMLIIKKVQNAILAKGYVTTRVMAQEQDLTKGLLVLTVQPGRVAKIRFGNDVSWRGRLWNAVPASSGDILNLRDVEQGLENFKRVPSATADIKIVPGEREATSDLVVNWQETQPVRLNIGLDDSGSQSTGRYLGTVPRRVSQSLLSQETRLNTPENFIVTVHLQCKAARAQLNSQGRWPPQAMFT